MGHPFIYCKYVLVSLMNKEMVGRWLLGRRRAESWRSGDSQKEQDGKYVDEPRGSTWMDGNGLIEVIIGAS